MPLSMARTNNEVTVVDFRGNLAVRKRLNELGLIKGTRIKIIQGSKNGSMLIKVLNSKLVINLSTAHGVIVS
ncbi:FeoA family protein [Proteocatella sphenisci]|uniref:FeoA family protein n=1 Tax=Proteocatella sphenisci TaxID=181070 RepID=UPI00048F9CFC|nr:FeoA family protein [Proteocatella sphenisci]